MRFIFTWPQCYENKLLKMNNDKDGITIINTDDKNAVEYDTELDLYKIREQMEELNLDRKAPLVSICFLAYNNLERLNQAVHRGNFKIYTRYRL